MLSETRSLGWRSVVIAVVTTALAVVASAQDAPPDAPPAEAVVADLAQILAKGVEAERDAAAEALVGHGAAAMPVFARNLPAPTDPAWSVAMEVGRGVGPEVAVAAILADRSGWRASGDADRINAYLDALRAEFPAAARITVRMATDALTDPARLPHGMARAVTTELPPEWTWGDHPTRPGKKDGLDIAVRDPGRFDVKLKAGTWRVLALGSKKWPRHVVVFPRLGSWWAAPAVTLRGAIKGRAIEFLDADADGTFDGAVDLVSVGGGPFVRVGDRERTLWMGDRIAHYSLSSTDSTLDLVLDPEPTWAGRSPQDGWVATNDWRAAAGLPPQALDLPRTAGCVEHHRYWQINGFSGHDQDRTKKGASTTGAVAGARASVWAVGSPATLVHLIGATVLHRGSLLGDASQGLGVFGGPSGSLIWGGSVTQATMRAPLTIPGAGQRGVPREIEREVPDPEQFPTFYDSPRGFPISVHYGGSGERPANVQFTVQPVGSDAVLDGTTFGPDARYHSNFSRSHAVFVPSSPLEPGTWYQVRFQATDANGAVDLAWWFSTGFGELPKRLEK